MNSELEVLKSLEEQEKVVTLYAQGQSLSDIKKETGLTTSVIKQHLENFRDFAKNDRYMAARSREVVLVVDQHYSEILKQYYNAIKEADINGDYKAKMTGLSAVAKIENDRVAFLAKAGLVADSHVGDMMAEAEEREKIIIDVLRKISSKYPKVGKEIQEELARLSRKVEPVQVDG